MRAAASRIFWTAGKSRPIRIAMMAITTSSSISVKAIRLRGSVGDILTTHLRQGKDEKRRTAWTTPREKHVGAHRRGNGQGTGRPGRGRFPAPSSPSKTLRGHMNHP